MKPKVFPSSPSSITPHGLVLDSTADVFKLDTIALRRAATAVEEFTAPDVVSAAARARFSTGTHETVSQNRLVVMCFERISRDLSTAVDALAAGDLFSAHTNLVHAQDIIVVLRDSLDTEMWDQGSQLLSLYDWSLAELAGANTTKDAVRVAAVAAALTSIGTAFEGASRTVRAANVIRDVPFAGPASAESSLSVRA